MSRYDEDIDNNTCLRSREIRFCGIRAEGYTMDVYMHGCHCLSRIQNKQMGE